MNTQHNQPLFSVIEKGTRFTSIYLPPPVILANDYNHKDVELLMIRTRPHVSDLFTCTGEAMILLNLN